MPHPTPCPDTTTTLNIKDDDDMSDLDDMSRRLRREAYTALEQEPELTMLLHNTVLAPGVRTFEQAVATTVTYRLLLRPCHTANSNTDNNNNSSSSSSSSSSVMFCPNSLRGILADAFASSTLLEAGHSMAEAVRLDAMAVLERDPAVDSLLEIVLFLKGFAALVCHRAAHYKWHSTSATRKSMTALWLQSQASAVFGVDIHPAAVMGAGILLDHGTGIVIGETATVGDGCTLLHGVTLGGTGKDSGDRHPKVGHDVLIGANASLLGNITIGNGAKIGAGSIVLGPIPSGATAVGAPARIIGRARESKPASTMDETLQQVSLLHKSTSSSSTASTSLTESTSTGSIQSNHEGNHHHHHHHQQQQQQQDNDITKMERATTNNNNINNDDNNEWGNDEEALASSEEGDGDPDNASEDDPHDKNNNNDTNDKKDHTPTSVTVLRKQQRHSTTSNNNNTNCCCPFRDYVRMARSAPKGTITICALRRFLNPQGCSASEVGEVLFALDTRNVGYVKPTVFFTDATARVIAEKTNMPLEHVTARMKEFQQSWQQPPHEQPHEQQHDFNQGRTPTSPRAIAAS